MNEHTASNNLEGQAVVLFDGVCNLCHGAVRFILERDRHRRFRFASLQSPAGRGLLEAHGRDPDALDTMVLFDPEAGVFERSDAALRIARGLRFPWPVLTAFRIIPRPLRDAVYNWIAAHRVRWFGQRDSCGIPSQEDRARFLEDGIGP